MDRSIGNGVPRFVAPCALLIHAMVSQAQVNAYAEVTAITGTTLTLSGADESFDTFENGEQAILMQMQDDVIGPYLSNSSQFGSLYGISSAGKWEVVSIQSHTESLGLPVSVVVSTPLLNVFHFGVKSRVQLISFPELGSPDYTTTGPITALPWNGSIGGVVGFQVRGILNLADDVSASYCGFRGGLPSTNSTSSCNTFNYTTSLATYGEKGEGLQRVSSTAYRYGRGRFLHGGGGGNPRNSGGAGGGHFTDGGAGGGGYACGTPGAGGIGGRQLSTFVYWDRFFMGGGGGGGQQNNSIGGAGGAGGGIVIVKADTLATLGPCLPLHISANGANGGSSIGLIPDGAGGGGAGGTVYLNVNVFQVDPSCSIICEANGGLGGQVLNTTPPPGNWLDTNGGGGGGGQGAVMCNGSATGLSGATASGTGGTHDPGGGRAFDASGAPNSGVIGFGAPIALPVELLRFEGHDASEGVQLEWSTSTEQNCERFDVERSTDMQAWNHVFSVPASGNSQQQTDYSGIDDRPHEGTNYYRLRIVDLDGAFEHSSVITVDHVVHIAFVLHPVPADDRLVMEMRTEQPVAVEVHDTAGRPVQVPMERDGSKVVLSTAALTPGTWWIRATLPDGTARCRMFTVLH